MSLTTFFKLVAAGILLGLQAMAAASPLWSNTFEGADWFKAWSAKESWGLKDNCSAKNGVLSVRYPKGSASPAASRKDGVPLGGAQWYARPLEAQEDLYLRYCVRFPRGFDFVKGGKLPGLFGGTEASGGKKPDGTNGFSTRYMWRDQGDGELYAYLYGHDDPFGISIGRGTFRFQPGNWHCLEQHVRLNTPGQANGVMTVWADGAKVIDMANVQYRTAKTLQIEGIMFSTFFGGSDSSWATPKDVVIEFKDFALSKKPVEK
jgi:hypothetical protein